MDNGKKASESDYERLELLGQGSFGEVHLARHRATDRLFALKTIDKGFIRRQRKEHSVFQEKLILCALNSPHTARLLATFQNEKALNFVLEYASGGSLAQLLARRGRLSLAETRFCAASVALILEHVHGWGVVHRDLKPENLLLDGEGRLKLADFGAAGVVPLPGRNDALFADFAALRRRAGLPVHGWEPESPAQGKSLVGTVYYVAPEMLDEREVGAGCDLWALGVLLHRLVTGRYLFDGVNDFHVFESIKRCEYSLEGDVDRDLADLIRQLVLPDPQRRLGAGPGGPAALKAHAFFAEVDFARLLEAPSPLAPRAEACPRRPSCTVLRGPVKRKRLHFFFEALELSLYDDGRVECADASSGEVRQRLQLALGATAREESARSFRLRNDGRETVFYAAEDAVQLWVQRFGEVVAGLRPPCP